jgi:hypothetical protein
MTPAAAGITRLTGTLRAIATVLALAIAALPAVAAKDTPLGFQMIPANMPNSTDEDIAQALRITAAHASHSSFIWHWSETQHRQTVIDLIPQMHAFGLKSLAQIGAIFLRVPAPPSNYTPSFGNAHTRAQYIRDVQAIAAARPDYLVLATEINLLGRFNLPEFEHYRTLYTDAYHAVKAISPNTKVGASFLYTVWFAEYFLDDNDVPSKLQPMDFIAFTAYPIEMIDGGLFESIDDIPAEWFGSLRLAYPNAEVIFSEIGWPSKYHGTPETQAHFVRSLPRLFGSTNSTLLTWAVLHDMEFYGRHLLDPTSTAFLESLGVDIDALFSHFNGMGLLDGFGVPKPAFLEATTLEFGPATP